MVLRPLASRALRALLEHRVLRAQPARASRVRPAQRVPDRVWQVRPNRIVIQTIPWLTDHPESLWVLVR